MQRETLEIMKTHMSHTEPIMPAELMELVGVSRATVYNGLAALGAIRHHVGKNQFAYTLPEPSVERPEIDTPGIIDGISWAEYLGYALDYVKKIHLKGNPTPESYIKGFQQIADTFQTITDHVQEVADRPDWRLVLGIDKEN